jgi:hypothetical protein
VQSAAGYASLYTVFVLPTYFLPYVGSNSQTLWPGTGATEFRLQPFLMHVVVLGVLITLAWLRGSVISRSWIVIFPVAAGVIDFAPSLSTAPILATLLHVSALVLGVTGKGESRHLRGSGP